MSIEANYRRVTTAEFAKLKRSRKAADEFFFGFTEEELDDPEKLLAKMQEKESSDRYFSIGKDWHALHFLLTGDGSLNPDSPLPPPPLGNVVQGGTPTPWECTYGHVRSLSPEEVREVAIALEGISVEELRSRFKVKEFNVAGIYPLHKAWTAEEAESVFMVYPKLVKFFRQAAKAGDMVLLSSD
jgi:hypothetical protein